MTASILPTTFGAYALHQPSPTSPIILPAASTDEYVSPRYDAQERQQYKDVQLSPDNALLSKLIQEKQPELAELDDTDGYDVVYRLNDRQIEAAIFYSGPEVTGLLTSEARIGLANKKLLRTYSAPFGQTFLTCLDSKETRMRKAFHTVHQNVVNKIKAPKITFKPTST